MPLGVRVEMRMSVRLDENITLVDPVTRACKGRVSLTLVYDPPVDQAFGTEFVRVNLDAKLQQRQLRDDRGSTKGAGLKRSDLPQPHGLRQAKAWIRSTIRRRRCGRGVKNYDSPGTYLTDYSS